MSWRLSVSLADPSCRKTEKKFSISYAYHFFLGPSLVTLVKWVESPCIALITQKSLHSFGINDWRNMQFISFHNKVIISKRVCFTGHWIAMKHLGAFMKLEVFKDSITSMWTTLMVTQDDMTAQHLLFKLLEWVWLQTRGQRHQGRHW